MAAFAGDTARFYARYRREYPSELIARLREYSRDGRGRLLDLGCGTGQLVLQLAPFFEHAVGIDPEPDMLREAESAARGRRLENVEWAAGSSRELPALGHLDLVTIATAFHFMDPQATLGDLRQIAGAVAIVYNGSPMWLHPDPWAKALRGVLERRVGQLGDVDFTAEALRAAEETMRDLRYESVERWEHVYTETIDVDFVVGHILSATSTDQIPAAERRHFAEDVRSAIAGHVVETVAVRAVIGLPPPRTPGRRE